jgi:hypothetical protein
VVLLGFCQHLAGKIDAPHLSTKKSKPAREIACTRAEIKHGSANLYSRQPDDAAQNFIIPGKGELIRFASGSQLLAR